MEKLTDVVRELVHRGDWHGDEGAKEEALAVLDEHDGAQHDAQGDVWDQLDQETPAG